MGLCASKDERIDKIHRERRLADKAKEARVKANQNPPGPGPPDGFRGEHCYGNGDRATGTFVNGKLNGRGRFYKNHPWYPGWREGTFRDNELQGQGKKQRPDMLSWDEGEFVDDNLVKGRLSAPKDTWWLYDEGQFKWVGSDSHGWTIFREGRVVRQFRDGSRFEGLFTWNGTESEFARGTLFWLDPNDVADGDGAGGRGRYGERFEGTFHGYSPSGRGRYDRQGRLMDGEFAKTDRITYHSYEWYDAPALAQKKKEDARREREAERKRELDHARIEAQARAHGKDTTGNASAVAAGWSAMQQNPANNWVAGGIGNC